MTLFRGFRLGALFGFPIRVHVSFLVLLGLVFVFMGGLPGVALVLMVAGSVLVHELGHALLARHLGVPVREIGLHFFGGAAQLEGLPRRPGDEIAIAAAGPAVSFALAGSGFLLSTLTAWPLFGVFAWVNLVLAAFNLLPAFPSDGGRILRAWLARKVGFVRATELAVTTSRVVCIALIAAGIHLGSFQLVMVAIALWTFGTAERISARLRGDHGAWRGSDAPPAPLGPVDYIPPPAARPGPVLSGRQGPFVVWWR
jgi:Zn-dependent protease